MSHGERSEAEQPELPAGELIDQMFALWIEPHVKACNLDISRDQVAKALVVLHPDGAPEVLLNDQAELIAAVKVRKAVAAGAPVMAENVEHVSGLRPASIRPNAGWIAFALMPGGGIMVAFDFRYNRDRAADLLVRATEFLETGHEALTAGRLGPAVEAALAAGELAVTAMASLQNVTHRGRNSHGARQAWLNSYTHVGNGTPVWFQALRRLLDARPAARYGDTKGGAMPTATELAEFLHHVGGLVDHATRQASGPVA